MWGLNYTREIWHFHQICVHQKKIAIDSVHEKLENETISRVPLNARTTEGKKKKQYYTETKILCNSCSKNE